MSVIFNLRELFLQVYNTTEIYETGVGFSKGPDLPRSMFQHCLVKINATHLFIVGGFPYSRLG